MRYSGEPPLLPSQNAQALGRRFCWVSARSFLATSDVPGPVRLNKHGICGGIVMRNVTVILKF